MLGFLNQTKTIQRAGDKQAFRDFAILYQYASALLFFNGEEMKRFTETLKWDDPWYRKLSCKHKAFWQYICDKCDNAGVWKIDYELASFQLGENIAVEDLAQINNGKERLVIKEDILVIKDFIPFQIGKLTGDTLTNLQKNCLHLIDEYKKKGLSLTGKLRVSYPKLTGIGKGKGKGKGKDKDILVFWDYFLLKTKKNFLLTDDRKTLIRQRLSTHNLDDLKKAVDNFVADDWEGRAGHLDLIYCIGKQKGKPDNLEKWLNIEAKSESGERLRPGTKIPLKYFNKE